MWVPRIIVSSVGRRVSVMLRVVHRAMPKMTLTSWLFLTLPLALCLSLIISVGPAMQQSLFNAIDYDKSSIYSSVYDDSITTFPSLLDWWSLGAWWVNLLMGGVIAVFVLRASKLKSLMVATAAGSAVTLTFVDFVGALAQREFYIEDQIANVVANSIGGVAIALLVGLALWLYWAATTLQLPRTSTLVLSAATLAAFGFGVSGAAYFLLRFVFEPLPATVSATLNTPTSGFYWAEHKSPQKR
jgi:hypothetical protein